MTQSSVRVLLWPTVLYFGHFNCSLNRHFPSIMCLLSLRYSPTVALWGSGVRSGTCFAVLTEWWIKLLDYWFLPYFFFFFWSAPSPVVEDKRSLLYFKGMPRVKIIPLFLQQRGCKESFREKCVGSDNAFWLVRNETTRIRGLHCPPSFSPFFKGTSKGLNSLCSGLKFSI